MKDQFYVVLPSNSSMSYFNDNTTTHFITRLPQHLFLHGSWAVALTEIQIPMTFQHVPVELEERYVSIKSIVQISNEIVAPIVQQNENISYLLPGVYKDIQSLMLELNELMCLRNHVSISLNLGGYIKIKSICSKT